MLDAVYYSKFTLSAECVNTSCYTILRARKEGGGLRVGEESGLLIVMVEEVGWEINVTLFDLIYNGNLF